MADLTQTPWSADLNYQIARQAGLNVTSAGHGEVTIALASASPAQKAAYEAIRRQYQPSYTVGTIAQGDIDNAKAQYAAYLASKPPVAIDDYQSNQVQNPSLPSNTELNPALMQAQPGEKLTTPAGVGDNSVAPSSPIGAPPNLTAAQGQVTNVNPDDVTGLINPNAGKMNPTLTHDAGEMEAAQGQINELDTVQGQLKKLYSDFDGTNPPPWAKGAMTKANEVMAARGISNSSLAGVAIAEAIQQSAINIAAPDAATYFAMDMANLSNRQQANLTNAQFRQQNMLTDTSIQNASAQFNAASEAQTQQFVASLVSSIKSQNADRTASMEQFNANERNKMAVQDVNNQIQIQEFNKQNETALKTFNAQLQSEREKFNSTMQFSVDQSNVLWQRTINTANTAATNAANQVNVQNSFNLSQQALNNLWQQWRDEASWAFSAAESQADRDYNLAIASNNRDFINSQNQPDYWSEVIKSLGSFAANIHL